MKRKLVRMAIVVSAIAVIGAFVAGPAGATPPVGYGFDDTSHVIVGGGSDTTYFTMQQVADDWARSNVGTTGGCNVSTAVGPNLNQCITSGNPETNDLGNWQHDTLTHANPVGSSAGIASLNAFNGAAYGGTVNGSPTNVDFARSSRGPKSSGGNCSGGNELTCDTFWGYGQDGIQVSVFIGRGAQVQGAASPAIPPTELFHIFNCDYANWSDVPSLGITPGSPQDGPLVPWGMQTSSGTFGSFQSYIQNNASGVPAGWSPDAPTGVANTGAGYTSKVGCMRKLSNGNFPFENDMKPIVNDPASLSSTNTSVDNPINWITWGSFGVLSTFPFLASPARGGTTYSTFPAPVNGTLPSTSNIGGNSYPIGRTLYHVTRKADADCAKTGTACDFTGNPGPTLPSGSGNDLNVTGGSSGVAGAVREFTRFLCRQTASQHQPDPYTGTNYFTEITQALGHSGFTIVPTTLRTAGSRCQVLS